MCWGQDLRWWVFASGLCPGMLGRFIWWDYLLQDGQRVAYVREVPRLYNEEGEVYLVVTVSMRHDLGLLGSDCCTHPTGRQALGHTQPAGSSLLRPREPVLSSG